MITRGDTMEMTIHLDPDIFKIVKAGVKHIEARVNDEKKKKITCW